MHHYFSVPVSTLCPLYLRHPGTKLTASMILERLEKEARTNVGLEIASSPPQQGMSDAAEVCGGRCVLCGPCFNREALLSIPPCHAIVVATIVRYCCCTTSPRI